MILKILVAMFLWVLLKMNKLKKKLQFNQWQQIKAKTKIILKKEEIANNLKMLKLK